MPASPSRNRDARTPVPQARRRSYGLLIAAALLGAAGALLVALPASLLTHVLPPGIGASDLSGSVWHGSAGSLLVNGRRAGALEWRLHPSALLHLALQADVHWVKLGLAVDGTVEINRARISASAIAGGGPLEDLADLGIAPGWRGLLEVSLPEVSGTLQTISAARGDIRVSGLASPGVAGGEDLGGYALHFDAAAVDENGTLTGGLTDLGGPLAVNGTLALIAAARSGTISATIQERAAASPALRSAVADLARMRGRDTQGRIPVDLEFNF